MSVLTILLAGGKGTRLEPLTRDRAKPAVPFGGQYRIIDFTLSNCINSNLRHILILTQYKARSLERHIQRGWNFLSRPLGEYIDVLPPEQRMNDQWYRGTADALYQNIYSIEQEQPELILVLGGDHIYKMDYRTMIEAHRERQADVTVACLPVPIGECSQFGVMQVNSENRILAFEEKPEQAAPMPDDPARCLASMGIYVFKAELLYDWLCADATRKDSSHDFGKDLLPRLVETNRLFAFPFVDKNRKAQAYWRDVGTLEAYYDANMDLIATDPVLNLYDRDWPIRTWLPQLPPPKFVHGEHALGPNARRGEAIDSLVGLGSIISGSHVFRSILSPNVRINSYSWVEDSILFSGVTIGRHCQIRRTIIEKGVNIPEKTSIGYNADADREKGYILTDAGITVVPKGV
ncbi:MAG: glucose-1-phosphate adenylyltransferase [Planctomycetia bacterium]|nr:glucose-1-phosphate adenylyltransferase [Planctomycetia bacterium]